MRLLPPATFLLPGLCLVSWTPLARADWADEVGWNALQAELGAATPRGSGVRVTQVEALVAPGAYAPVAGSGVVAVNTASFLNKSFDIKSGPSIFSWHANEVAQQICGSPPANPRYGMATGVSNVDIYEANQWVGPGYLHTGSISAPTAETSRAQNHSWIYFPTAAELPTMTEMLRRVDYSINTSNFVACVGMDNNAFTGVPILLATAGNVISVGLTNGAHSRGLTDSSYDLPGRSKPELVAPIDLTSFATGLVSGAATTLRSAATTTPAQRNETIRAILLAGATKTEFPNWSRTSTRPLDAIYGAGELHIQHSYHILAGGKQTSSATVPVALHGWDYRSYTANTDYDYLLQIPTAMQGASLSAVVVWNRPITRAGANYTAGTLPNLTLTLYKGTANPGTQWDLSASTGHNLEHIWQPALTCGTYRLRLSGDLTTNAAIAWRVIPAASDPTLSSNGLAPDQTITFQMTNLVPGQLYDLQSSGDLVTWTTLNAFTPSATSLSWTTAPLTPSRRLFRLSWTCP